MLAVELFHCQAKCCILRNNYLDNAIAKQVNRKSLHIFRRAIVNDEIFELIFGIPDALDRQHR